MRIAVHTIAALALLGTTAAHAQEQGGETRESALVPVFEITPFIGYRLGGDFDVEGASGGTDLDDHSSFGIALDLRADPGSQYELLYSRQAANLESDSPLGALGVDVEYFHIGGTLLVGEAPRLRPYIVATAGLTRFSPEPDGADDDTRFSFSLGAGLRVPVSPRFGLRLEARGYLTFMDTDSSVFCVSAGGAVCAIRASGSTFFQYEVLAGAAVAF